MVLRNNPKLSLKIPLEKQFIKMGFSKRDGKVIGLRKLGRGGWTMVYGGPL
jgi:hypothetical protein